MSTDTVTINENIFQFDNVLNGLNYLLEEVETRKEQLISSDRIDSIVAERMNTRQFKDNIVRRIQESYGEDLYREVAFIVMEKIDDSIEEFINARVDERLRSLGVMPQVQQDS